MFRLTANPIFPSLRRATASRRQARSARGRSPGSRCRSADRGAVRAAALARLPVLQLADVGDAEAVVRPGIAAERLTWFPILHDIFSRMWVALALGLPGPGDPRAGGGRRSRAPAAAVAGGRLAGTAGPRRRERAAVRLPDSRADRAGLLVLTRGSCCRRRPRAPRRAHPVLSARHPLLRVRARRAAGAMPFLDDVYAHG